jgi:hypothetical protein
MAYGLQNASRTASKTPREDSAKLNKSIRDRYERKNSKRHKQSQQNNRRQRYDAPSEGKDSVL